MLLSTTTMMMLVMAAPQTLSYGDDPKQRVDVYVPSASASPSPSPSSSSSSSSSSGVEAKPVALYLHGGVWQFGDRTDYRTIGQDLARAGFVTFVASYRLAPAHKWPAQLDDAKAVLSFALREAKRFGGDASRVVVVGHSAGGQLATLLALEDAGAGAGAGAKNIDALVLFSPVADVEMPLDESQRDGGFAQFIAPVFANTQLESASPLRALGPASKKKLTMPTLLITSERDYRAMHAQTVALHKAIVASGAQSELVDLPRVDHFEMVAKLDDALAKKIRALVK